MSIKKEIPRQVIILGLISLFTDLASEMLYPITPIFLTAILGSSMAVVGIIEGIAEVVAGYLKGYAGNISDKIGRRSIFIKIGYGLSAIAKPLPGLFPVITSVVISRTGDRVGKGIRTAPRDALLGSYSEGNSGAIFGFHRGMDTLGAVLGPLSSILLLYLFPDNFRLIFLAAFVPSVLAVCFTFLIKDKKISPTKRIKGNYLEFWRSSPEKYKRLIVLITIFSFANSSDVFLILKSNFVSDSYILAILGYVFYNIIYAVFSYPLGRLSDKFGKHLIYGGGLFIFSLVYFGFAFITQSFFFWILFALYGVYSASTEGVLKAWVSDLVPNENRGSAIGLLTMFSSFAIMLGSFATGLLWDAFGSTVPFLTSAVVSLAIGSIILAVRK
jgi:MFS family permease